MVGCTNTSVFDSTRYQYSSLGASSEDKSYSSECRGACGSSGAFLLPPSAFPPSADGRGTGFRVPNRDCHRVFQASKLYLNLSALLALALPFAPLHSLHTPRNAPAEAMETRRRAGLTKSRAPGLLKTVAGLPRHEYEDAVRNLASGSDADALQPQTPASRNSSTAAATVQNDDSPDYCATEIKPTWGQKTHTATQSAAAAILHYSSSGSDDDPLASWNAPAVSAAAAGHLSGSRQPNVDPEKQNRGRTTSRAASAAGDRREVEDVAGITTSSAALMNDIFAAKKTRQEALKGAQEASRQRSNSPWADEKQKKHPAVKKTYKSSGQRAHRKALAAKSRHSLDHTRYNAGWPV